MTKISQNLSAKPVRLLKDAEYVAPTAQATVNTYADIVGGTVDTLGYDSVSFVIKNTDDADDLDWKVLASNDNTTFVEVQAEETLGEGVTDSFAQSPALYRYYKIQVKSTSAGNHAVASVSGFAR